MSHESAILYPMLMQHTHGNILPGTIWYVEVQPADTDMSVYSDMHLILCITQTIQQCQYVVQSTAIFFQFSCVTNNKCI